MTALDESVTEASARLQARLAALERERDEAIEQQSAAADVLRVISRSPESLDTSLQAVADTAARLCRANFARVFLLDGDYLVAGPSGPPDASTEGFHPGQRLGPIAGHPGPSPHAVRTGRTVHTEDVVAFCDEHGGWPGIERPIHPSWRRVHLAVPLVGRSEVVGVLAFDREAGSEPFSRREVALAESFADQAAIAVENARLVQGIQARNREVT